MLSAENGLTVGRVEYAPDYGKWSRSAFGGRAPAPMEVDPRSIAIHLAGQSPTDRAAALVGTPYKENEQAGDNTFTRSRRVDPYEQWHLPPLTAANDNSKLPLMVGLTGKRNVGKSTFADVLEQEFGFNRIHAFESGKVAAEAYFASILRYLPDGADIARRMVWGDLKDKPSPYLPGNAHPRHYLESTGHHHGVELGVEWTLGMEVRAALAMNQNAPIVVESVVYESPWFRAQGGKVVRLIRPDFDGPVGVKSDAAQAELVADYEFTCSSVAEVESAARVWARQLRWAA